MSSDLMTDPMHLGLTAIPDVPGQDKIPAPKDVLAMTMVMFRNGLRDLNRHQQLQRVLDQVVSTPVGETPAQTLEHVRSLIENLVRGATPTDQLHKEASALMGVPTDAEVQSGWKTVQYYIQRHFQASLQHAQRHAELQSAHALALAEVANVSKQLDEAHQELGRRQNQIDQLSYAAAGKKTS